MICRYATDDDSRIEAELAIATTKGAIAVCHGHYLYSAVWFERDPRGRFIMGARILECYKVEVMKWPLFAIQDAVSQQQKNRLQIETMKLIIEEAERRIALSNPF